MPLYEFECGQCGARFEALVDAGTVSVACRACGADETRRVYSAPGAPLRLVKAPGETRKQERRNTQLRATAKRDFKDARRQARDRRTGKP